MEKDGDGEDGVCATAGMVLAWFEFHQVLLQVTATHIQKISQGKVVTKSHLHLQLKLPRKFRENVALGISRLLRSISSMFQPLSPTPLTSNSRFEYNSYCLLLLPSYAVRLHFLRSTVLEQIGLNCFKLGCKSESG